MNNTFGHWHDWGELDGRQWIAVPGEHDDKYSRGVLGVITGSDQYPGAAVLGVEAAVRTGVGMVRYVGGARAQDFVLRRRPEVVMGSGRVQAWLAGSGMDAASRAADETAVLRDSLGQGLPAVLDAGALDLLSSSTGPTVITPHFRELSIALRGTEDEADPDAIAASPAEWADRAAHLLGVTVLLKGNTTYVAGPDGSRLRVSGAPTWLATAGSGDVLGGILGALVATHSEEIHRDPSVLARLAATAAALHGSAARRASAGGPIAALDIAEALPAEIAALLGG